MAPTSQNFQLCDSVAEALQGCGRGATVMVGGFGLSGIPENIIECVYEQPEITDLKIISTEAGDDNWGLGRLYQKNKIVKQCASYIGRAKVMEQAYLTGKTELELMPQGTLAEKVRCAGFGIPAFYSVAGLHTLYAEGKLPTKYNPDGSIASYNKKRETRVFNGKEYLLEEAFEQAEFAWIKATKADKMGNCIFKGTSWNFNGIMARAAKTVIVEAEEIVEVGDIPPEQVHLPGLYVNRLFKGAKYEHKIEVLKFSKDATSSQDIKKDDRKLDRRELIAHIAAQEFRTGMNCNLGVGIPTMAAGFAASMGIHVFLQSENGMTGCGPYPQKGEQDSDWINAGKESVTPVKGACTFGSDESFGQIRGGHLDMTVLGALECSQYGDVANFMIPGKMMKGMGGAMDLVSNPEKTKVVVVQTHLDKYGNSKIKKSCDLPITGARCVQTIVTDLAVFDVDYKTGLTLRKYNPDSSIEDIRRKTAADFKVAAGCRAWELCV